MEGKVEILAIDDNFLIQFIYIPEGFRATKVSLEGHKIKLIGRLNSFNNLKLLAHWRKQHPDLVKVFTDLLLLKEWDFVKFPNPVAYMCINVNKANIKLLL